MTHCILFSCQPHLSVLCLLRCFLMSGGANFCPVLSEAALPGGLYLLLGAVLSNDVTRYFIVSMALTFYAEIMAELKKTPDTVLHYLCGNPSDSGGISLQYDALCGGRQMGGVLRDRNTYAASGGGDRGRDSLYDDDSSYLCRRRSESEEDRKCVHGKRSAAAGKMRGTGGEKQREEKSLGSVYSEDRKRKD